ncbi:MAG: DGQHR domain-containing protein [Candidatus Helarchaeota archaeon]
MKKEIIAIKINQWLNTWNVVKFDKNKNRDVPEPYFYLFSISARALKRLSGVYRRSAKERKSAAEELGIQRKHDPKRSASIKEYVKNGFPWSELSQPKRESGKYDDLKNPGWLPTAIVVNILTKDSKRRGKQVATEDLITVKKEDENFVKIILPNSFNKKNWEYKQIPPIEIIDGQHRLWAFEDSDIAEDYELPVVAFHGLDIGWQAYLFYTINISPKKINRSLAYDLYPLLRNEEWLQRFEGPGIYRETRAQELVDILFSHPESPWYQWINMLGDMGGKKMVSQAAWIRSLMASYIRPFEGARIKIGGLFGAPVGKDETVLPWGKEEQAALLIYVGKKLKENIEKNDYGWNKSLRNTEKLSLLDYRDPAFYGKNTLLNQDQGIRVVLYITNDFLYINSDKLKLETVFSLQQEGDTLEIISKNLCEINENTKLSDFLCELLEIVSRFDWRSFSADGLSEEEKLKKAGYRGSGGYKVLRNDLLKFIHENGNDELMEIAKKIKQAIG